MSYHLHHYNHHYHLIIIIRWSLVTSFLVTIVLVTCTSFGFPYTGDPAWPAPKRLSVFHVARSVVSSRHVWGHV